MDKVLSSAEQAKAGSRFLRGDIPEELANEADVFSKPATAVLKFHGIYQQDDRDLRKAGVKQHSAMVRVGILFTQTDTVDGSVLFTRGIGLERADTLVAVFPAGFLAAGSVLSYGRGCRSSPEEVLHGNCLLSAVLLTNEYGSALRGR